MTTAVWWRSISALTQYQTNYLFSSQILSSQKGTGLLSLAAEGSRSITSPEDGLFQGILPGGETLLRAACDLLIYWQMGPLTVCPFAEGFVASFTFIKTQEA